MIDVAVALKFTASGGSGSYTYAWTVDSGNLVSFNDPSAPNTGCTSPYNDPASIYCAVSDDGGATWTNSNSVSINP